MEKSYKIDSEKLKRCPACGNFFTCTTEGDCWCHEYKIPKKNMMVLMQKYNDCLCPTCLKEYEEG